MTFTLPLSGGAASYTVSSLAHGVHTVAAEYAGDANFLGTTNMLPTLNWQALGTATADAFGSFVLVDAAGSSLRFYRAIYP